MNISVEGSSLWSSGSTYCTSASSDNYDSPSDVDDGDDEFSTAGSSSLRSEEGESNREMLSQVHHVRLNGDNNNDSHYNKRNNNLMKVEQRNDGYYYVSYIPRKCKSYGVGDRILEINGIPYTKFQNEHHANEIIASLILECVSATSKIRSPRRPPSPATAATTTTTTTTPTQPSSGTLKKGILKNSPKPNGTIVGRDAYLLQLQSNYHQNVQKKSIVLPTPFHDDEEDEDTDSRFTSSSSVQESEPAPLDPSTFQRRSQVEEEARKVATKRAATKKKQMERQQQPRRKIQVQKRRQPMPISNGEEELGGSSHHEYPTEHVSPIGNTRRLILQSPTRSNTKKSPVKVESKEETKSKDDSPIPPSPPPPPRDLVVDEHQTPPTPARRKKAAGNVKKNSIPIGAYSPKRSDGWQKCVSIKYQK